MSRTTTPRTSPPGAPEDVREKYAARLISLQEVAERLDVHERTARRLIEDGKLPAYRVGGRIIRVRASDVEALLTPISPVSA